MSASSLLLDLRNLSVKLPAGAERSHAVQNVSYTLSNNEILCVVGESGSGKSITARAIMGLLPAPHVSVDQGNIFFNGEDLNTVKESRMREIRGGEISMIFQEPMTALNPVMTIGKQIDEVIRFHTKIKKKHRRQRALALIESVHLPDPQHIFKAYPHELSGGQRQRAMIAMALAMEPKVLIADEPTTALDVTTQAQILKLIKELQQDHDTGVLFITHDFGVVADIADRVAVMQHGEIVEIGTTDQVLNHPEHPYTQALMEAVPSLIPPAVRAISDEVELSVNNLTKTFKSGGGWFGLGGKERIVHAAKDVSVKLHKGETLGIVGESGSGKSTLAQEMRAYRAKIQMVFQDPFASLNPRSKVGRIIADGPRTLGVDSADADKRAREMLELVGLDARAFDRYPHEFSGGQRQRIGIARALALDPEILVADEPVSALDVSIQAQILELLADIRERLQLSMIFITHDLRVAAQVCDRIAVMRLGKIVESGPTSSLFEKAEHPYTQELLSAVPGRDWQSH